MNKCFKCGTEYEGKYCPNCGAKFEETKICPQCNNKLDGQAKFCNNCGYGFVKQSVAQTNNASDSLRSLVRAILKFFPPVLFVLWAGLLWAFYSAKILADNFFGLIQGNLYDLLNDTLFEDFHSQLKIFIVFAVIADIYALVYLLVQLKSRGKIKIFSHAICLTLQLCIVIFTEVLSSKIKEDDLEQGNFVAITIALTVVFAFLQIVALLLQRHFDNNVNTVTARTDNGMKYVLNGDKKSYSVTVVGKLFETDIVIQANFNGLPVTSIANGAFCGYKITSIVIPDSVISIGCDAFNDCTNLVSVTIGRGVTSIGHRAFDCCQNLKMVYFANPNGWKVWTKTISASDLSDPTTAATYLRNSYSGYDWRR